MRPHALRKLFAVLGAALLLAGCGSSAQAPSPSPSASASATASVEGSLIERLPLVPRPTATPTPQPTAATLTQEQFATQIFNDAQAMWAREFQEAGMTYHAARLVLFSSSVETACGSQPSEVGPFYCPADATVYLDLAFLTALQNQLGAPGNFARAYIIAHEVAHHLQSLLGIHVRAARLEQQQPALASPISVRVELQADCLAGVWAHSTYQRNLIGPSDLAQALRAAAAVGDDFQQHLAGQQVQPENWSHGSSAQRQEWLQRGFDSGSAGSCDTFAA